MDLFNVTTGLAINQGARPTPRAANPAEIRAYCEWLARKSGLIVQDKAHLIGGETCARGAIFGEQLDRGETRWDASTCSHVVERAEQWSEGAFCVAMPGYGQSSTITMDVLDDDGAVVRTIMLPTDQRKGALAIDKAAVARFSGLKPVRKVKAKAAPAHVEPVEAAPAVCAPAEAPEPITTPSAPIPAATGDLDALVSRVAALEAALAASGRPAVVVVPAAANDAQARPVRTPAERRAIQRAWNMRRDMRARADLDRRALLIANGDNRLLRETLVRAKEQAANARRAATDYKREVQAACDRADDEASRAVRAESERDGANRYASTLATALRTTESRASRLARVATTQRRARAAALDSAGRAADDLRAARAETRAVQRRLEALQDAVASSPAAAAVINRRLVAA